MTHAEYMEQHEIITNIYTDSIDELDEKYIKETVKYKIGDVLYNFRSYWKTRIKIHSINITYHDDCTPTIQYWGSCLNKNNELLKKHRTDVIFHSDITGGIIID